MIDVPQILYRSENGDSWWLIRDPASGQMLVRHEANPSSGGQRIEMPVDDFLSRDGAGPEYAAARRLIAASVRSVEPRQ